MFRDSDIEEIERRKKHNEAMRKAGEQFGKLVDGSGDAQKEAVVDALFSAYRTKYDLPDDGS